MPKIILREYSDYYDVTTGIQFQPTLDRRTGTFVAIADVTEAQAEAYAERSAFHILTDDEFLALSKPAAAPAPTPSQTGDPLTDQADQKANVKISNQQAQTIDLTGPEPPKSN